MNRFLPTYQLRMDLLLFVLSVLIDAIKIRVNRHVNTSGLLVNEWEFNTVTPL